MCREGRVDSQQPNKHLNHYYVGETKKRGNKICNFLSYWFEYEPASANKLYRIKLPDLRLAFSTLFSVMANNTILEDKSDL